MKSLFLLTCLFCTLTSAAEVAKLRYSPEFIFSKVLEILKRESQETVMPEIRFASQANLKDFQDDVEKQWGFRPEVITNVYASAVNRIYISDSADYYQKTGRCMDDSLAHEYVHYVQVHYMKIPVERFDDSMEWQAVDVQTQFREKFCRE